MLDLINWIRDGNYRIKTIELLLKKSYLSSELANALNINRASMSRILRLLKEKEIVNNITSGSRTVTYTLSDKGKLILKKIQEDYDVKTKTKK